MKFNPCVINDEKNIKNPLIKCGWFGTPQTFEELKNLADQMRNKSEANMIMVFTLNYCYDLFEKELSKNNQSEEL
jgi:hypothetical protein